MLLLLLTGVSGTNNIHMKCVCYRSGPTTTNRRFLSATAPSKSSAAAYSSMSRLRDIIGPPRNYCIFCGIQNYLEQNRTTARHVFVHLLRRQWNWLCDCLMIEQSVSEQGQLGVFVAAPKNAPLAPLTQFPNLLSPPHNTQTLVGWQKYIRRRSELELGSKLLLLLLLSPVEITGWNSFTWGWMTVLFANSILLHCTLVSTLH